MRKSNKVLCTSVFLVFGFAVQVQAEQHKNESNTGGQKKPNTAFSLKNNEVECSSTLGNPVFVDSCKSSNTSGVDKKENPVRKTGKESTRKKVPVKQDSTDFELKIHPFSRLLKGT
jgi:hypothetical protein